MPTHPSRSGRRWARSSACSVPGTRAGMTDALFAGAAAAADGDMARARRIVADQLDRHAGVGRSLLSGDAAVSFHDQLAQARQELAGLLDGLAGRVGDAAALRDEIV